VSGNSGVEIPQFTLLQEWFPQSHCHPFEPCTRREQSSTEIDILEREGTRLLDILVGCPDCTKVQSGREGVDEVDSVKGRIVFFGHDLGGSVIKRALILATESPLYRRVAEKTRAIFFFGGLHSKDKKEGWERHLTNLLSVSQKNVNDVFGELQNLPMALSILSENFINISGYYDMFNIYEKSRDDPEESQSDIDKRPSPASSRFRLCEPVLT
jgi:hypothetical protein